MKVTLALLAYNEEAVIDRTVREAAAQMQQAFAADEWELLVIDDGSRDRTSELCASLVGEVAGVRVYSHNPNRGYVEATLSALREARGEYVCIFDGDGQQTAADVPLFVERLDQGCDVVFGWKRKRYDEPLRLLLSRGLRLAARYYLHSRLHDINAGCRGFRREHAAALSVIKHRINFIGPELYTRARLHQMKICEVVVHHSPREGGISSHGLMNMPGEIAQVLGYLRDLRAELREAGQWRRFIP